MSSSRDSKDTYSLAHTARCKLHIAADRPDRDLRFVLGHAFTLDNVMLRVVEIEKENTVKYDPEQDEKDMSEWNQRVHATRPPLGGFGERRVSFQNTGRSLGSFSGRNRSPPAPPKADVSSSEDEDDDDDDDRDDRLIEEDEDSDDDDLSLRRFASGAARPPRLVDDESDSDSEDEDEPVSPEGMPSDAELQRICSGPESKELKGLYGDVKSCPCHGHDQSAPGVQKVWEWPKKVGDKTIAVVQFEEGGDLQGLGRGQRDADTAYCT